MGNRLMEAKTGLKLRLGAHVLLLAALHTTHAGRGKTRKEGERIKTKGEKRRRCRGGVLCRAGSIQSSGPAAVSLRLRWSGVWGSTVRRSGRK